MATDLATLLDENPNLIYSQIKHVHKNDKEDLFQAGVIGFVKAYQNYNDQYENKFTTYAYKYIQGEIRKVIREDRNIKVSRELNSLNYKLENAKGILRQQLMREPSILELADFLGVDEKRLVEAQMSAYKINSLEEVICDDGKELLLEDTVADIKKLDLDTLIDLRQEIEQLLPLEQRLIYLRYMEGLTQQETACQLGMSQVQVSRCEQKVLKKMRNNMTEYEFTY